MFKSVSYWHKHLRGTIEDKNLMHFQRSIRRCSLELWLPFSFFLHSCVVFRSSFHVGYCNLHATMAWIIMLKSTSEKTVTIASPDVQEMKDKVFLMTRASWRFKSSRDLTLIKAQLWERNEMWEPVLPYYGSEHRREPSIGTVVGHHLQF